MSVPWGSLLELLADARFGYDGGRHARLFQYASAAGVADDDWLLDHRLLTGHNMFVQDCSDEGCDALLAVDHTGDGGTIQGLSLPGHFDGPSTVYAEPPPPPAPVACSSADATLLRAYRLPRNNLPDGCWHADRRMPLEVAMTGTPACVRLPLSGRPIRIIPG